MLYLDYNKITDITSLSNLTNLFWLELSHNQITNKKPW
ncbi:leucine-rich repeat domain-containing protein [Kosmotoga pacifica]